MAVAAIAVGNLTSPALYVSSFHVEVFSDAGYTTLVGSKSCAAVRDASGLNWIQSDLIGFNGLVRGQTYYIQAGPVSPGGVANFNRYSIQVGTITIPACTYSGTYAATSSGVTYDIIPANIPTDIDHFEAIWTKDGSAPSNSSLDNAWDGSPLPNGYVHFFAGGSTGQTIHMFMRAISTSGGYQNWVAVDNRTVAAGGSGSTSAAGITYADGTTVEALKPAAAGADVTGDNTAADTAAVNGINAGHVSDTATSVGFLGKWWRTTSSLMYPPSGGPGGVPGGEFSYAPMITTHDAQINYDIWHEYSWPGASPVPVFPSGDDAYLYVRWVGYYFCSTSGTYTFGTNSDDGSNMYVNGTALVSDLASRHGALGNLQYLKSGTIALTAGRTYEIVIEYHQEDKDGGIQVLMTPPGGSVQILNVGAAYSNAAYTQYADGTVVDALKPAAAGADVTAVNVSADTSKVNGVDSSSISPIATLMPSQPGADVTSVNIPTELLVNGSFEQGLTGWVSGSGTVLIDKTQSKYGQQSVSSHGGGLAQTTPVALLAGHTYTAQGWVKTNGSVVGNGSQGASIGFSDPNRYVTVQKTNGTALNAAGVNPAVGLAVAAATDWTQIQFTFSVSTNCSLQFGIGDCYGTSTTANATAWFDGVSLTDITGGADVTSAQVIVYTGLSANLIPNGNFILGNIDGWVATTGSAPPYYFSGIGLGINPNGGACSPTFNVIPSQKYRISFTGAANSSGTNNIYHRIFYAATYQPNTQGATYTDLMASGSMPNSVQTYTYDWTCPADMHYASLGIYQLGDVYLYFTNVSAQDYGSASQWGADVTGSNTSADTTNVSGVPSSTIASVIPNGYKLYINSGSRSYSITAV